MTFGLLSFVPLSCGEPNTFSSTLSHLKTPLFFPTHFKSTPYSYVALRKVPATGPRPFQKLHNLLKKYTPWQILIGALTTLYAAHHADLLLSLTPAEPEKKMVRTSFFLHIVSLPFTLSPILSFCPSFPSQTDSIAPLLLFHAHISCFVPPLPSSSPFFQKCNSLVLVRCCCSIALLCT